MSEITSAGVANSPGTTERIASLLQEMAQRLEMAGASRFQVEAYDKAADQLGILVDPLEELVLRDDLKSIPGVGPSIAAKIESIYRTGTHPDLERLRRQWPMGVIDLVRIPGVGAKRAELLFTRLQINSLTSLKQACVENRLAKVKGVGKRVQDKILEYFLKPIDDPSLLRLNRASRAAAELHRNVSARYPELHDLTIVGDIRRGCELCRGIQLVATADLAVRKQFQQRSRPFLQVVPDEELGSALLLGTGSVEHIEQLQAIAQRSGWHLTQSGFLRGTKNIGHVNSEEEIYTKLSLPFIAPELREGRNELAWAQANSLPRLVCESDLRGTLHCHTDQSDGKDTVEAMASAAAERGLSYLGICDHSQSAYYAGGLKFETVLEQHRVIDQLNAARGKCHVFKGIESDILRDGALDYTPQQLTSFDFVVASVHGRFQLNRHDQTERILRAVRNPFTTILGHPTGRLLQHREPYDVDLDLILRTCAEHQVVVEINSDPFRLDLDWRWHQVALKHGCMFSINPDAHDIQALSYLKWGTMMARKGGLPRERILNSMDRVQISAFFRTKKDRAMGQINKHL